MPAQRKYREELRERAVKMVVEIRARDGKGHGELARVGRQLGVHPEALRVYHGRQPARGACPKEVTLCDGDNARRYEGLDVLAVGGVGEDRHEGQVGCLQVQTPGGQQ